MKLRHGVHPMLEEEANRILRRSLTGVNTLGAKEGILSPWQEQERRRREVYVPSGVPDAASRSGIFRRASNPSRPDLNAREGVARGSRTRSGSSVDGLSSFVSQHLAGD